jgi:hypothetical protein
MLAANGFGSRDISKTAPVRRDEVRISTPNNNFSSAYVCCMLDDDLF